MEAPSWWQWELELTVHLEERMEDRGFSEVDLRQMLEDAASLVADHSPGRWLVETRHKTLPWVVVVEPDEINQVLVVITAFQRGM